MIRAALIALGLAAGAAQAETCRDLTHQDISYSVCEVDMAQADLRLFLRRADGVVHGGFSSVDDALAAEGKRLAVAMNAGMYHPNRRPVGLYVENGTEEMRLVTSAGPGNFGLQPNGVFCVRDGTAAVIETGRFAADPPACRHATQSGPMLVIDGALHPRFLPDSTSRYLRNGVGVRDGGRRVVLAISNQPVTFHEFGTLFRDVLATPNALYLDGNISRLYAPGLGRDDFGFPLGPILGVVVPDTDG